MSKRTAKDEADYLATLKREEPIKTEVLVELRDQNKLLWESQANLLRSLIESQEALLVYRRQALTWAERCARSSSQCLPGCTKHEWHDSDGWHRRGESLAQ